MTETAIAKPFDPSDLAEQLRDKIRVDMATLMPDEMWQELLEKEIQTFFVPQKEQSYPGSSRSRMMPSVFHGIVIEVLREKTKEQLKAMLNTEEWAGFWEKSELIAGEKIKELIAKNATEILSALLANSLQSTIQSMRGNL